MPDFNLADQKGRPVTLVTHTRGLPILLLFYPDHHKPACQQLARGFAELHDKFEARAQIYAITCESVEANKTAADRHGLPFRVLCDDGRIAARAYGIAHNLPEAALDFLGTGAFTSILADPNRRILAIKRAVTEPEHAGELLRLLGMQEAETAIEMPVVAPLLCVPRVFDEAYCRKLIEVYETQGNEASGTLYNAAEGGSTVKLDPDLKVRRDHFLQDPTLVAEVMQILKARVLPEIFKAFNYRVTRFEEFKIVCYEAASGGHFAPHRDNTSLPTAHRRFAMTLNLNSGEYQGGHLRFPEYGPHLYRPGLGDAVVFSCSVLHQALPVTAGRRFVLLSFFYGDEADQMKERRESGLGAGVG